MPSSKGEENSFDTGKAAAMAYTNQQVEGSEPAEPPKDSQLQDWKLTPQTRNFSGALSDDEIKSTPTPGNLSAKQKELQSNSVVAHQSQGLLSNNRQVKSQTAFGVPQPQPQSSQYVHSRRRLVGGAERE